MIELQSIVYVSPSTLLLLLIILHGVVVYKFVLLYMYMVVLSLNDILECWIVKYIVVINKDLLKYASFLA